MSSEEDNFFDQLLCLFKEIQDDSSETAGRPVKGGTTVPSDSPTEVTIHSNSIDSPPSGEGLSNWIQQQNLHLHAYAQDSAGNTNRPTEVTIDSQTPFRKGTAPVAAAPAAVADTVGGNARSSCGFTG